MTKEEADLIIVEQIKSRDEILKAVAKVQSDYQEQCHLKDMQIKNLESQIEQLKEHCDELEFINQKVMEENEQLEVKLAEYKN